MTNASSCINDVLPSEILQKIFLLSTETLKDALSISTTCRLWRKVIFNPFMIKHYWTFDNEHRKKGLIRWWNFSGNVNDQNNSFANFPTADCFLGKCVSLKDDVDIPESIKAGEYQCVIDRGYDYTVAFWLQSIGKGDSCRGLFMVSDDDWDYARSVGVGLDENDFLLIIFSSAISEHVVKSKVQIKPNDWFHIVLVQERQLDEETPRQHLWINGQLELSVEVPIAAYSSTANVSFYLWCQWNRCLADVSLWSRPLLPIEIRAIYEQKASIDKVDVAKYIFDHLNK